MDRRAGRRTSKPIAAMAGSRRAAVRKVPCGVLPGVPSERGKNSYQEPYRARSRSTSSGSGLRGGDQLAQRVPGQHRVHLRRQRRGEAGRRRDGSSSRRASTAARSDLAAAAASGRRRRRARTAARPPPGPVRVDARRDLDLRVVPPGGDRVAPGLDGVRPVARRAGGDVAPQRSVPGASSRIGVQGPGRPSGSLQDDVGGDRVVALAEHGGRDLEGLAGHGLGGPAPALDDRADVEDGNAPDAGRSSPAEASAPGRGGAGVGGAHGAALRAVPGVGGADEWCVAGMTAPVRVNVGGRMAVGRWVLRGVSCGRT